MHSLRMFWSEGGCSVDKAWVVGWIWESVCRCSESSESWEKVVRLVDVPGRLKSKGSAAAAVEALDGSIE